MHIRALALVASIAATAPAFAGTVVTSKIELPGVPARQSVMFIDGNHLRLQGPSSVTIFRGDQNTAYMLRPADKTFIKMTPETLKQLAAAVQRARAQVAEELKSMPPDQRARAEKMMQATAPAENTTRTFRKSSGTAQVGKWQCERIEEVVDGRGQANLCVVRITGAGLTAGDLSVLRQFSAFMRQGAPQTARAAAFDLDALRNAVGYEALPVDTEVPSIRMHSTVTAVETKSLPATLFEVPPDYKEQTINLPPNRP